LTKNMHDELVKKVIRIKRSFAKNYTGSAHIQEVIPSTTSNQFQMDEKHLELLHQFAKKNPIYFNFYEQEIEGISCVVYEGDINEYWLNSIKHGTSCQPFYPTWIISSYIMAFVAKELGYSELVDIGSGDGRIAFCGKILGLDSHSIEIDEVLVELQKTIVTLSSKNFNPKCGDALEINYDELSLTHPVFFIGGLPQMGGDILATGVIEKINSINDLKKNTGMVFAGTHSKRQLSGNISDGGWSELINKNNLNVIDEISLPTVWTFDQLVETPYIFTKFN